MVPYFLQGSSYVYKHIAIIHLLHNCVYIDVPYFKETNVTYHENNRAVLELGDMFYGGGVPIDHYIIQVEDGTQLETPGTTYSFDIMYNTSLSVNISAHNCAGYSDSFPLVLQYDDEGKSVAIHQLQTFKQVLISQNLDNMEKNMSDETDFMEKNMTRVTPTSELDNGITTWLLAALTVTGIIILTVLLIISLLVISFFVKHSKLLFSYSIN